MGGRARRTPFLSGARPASALARLIELPTSSLPESSALPPPSFLTLSASQRRQSSGSGERREGDPAAVGPKMAAAERASAGAHGDSTFPHPLPGSSSFSRLRGRHHRPNLPHFYFRYPVGC